MSPIVDPDLEVFNLVMDYRHLLDGAGVGDVELLLSRVDFGRFLLGAYKLKAYEVPPGPMWMAVLPAYVVGFNKVRPDAVRVPLPVGGVYREQGLTVGVRA